MREIAGLVGEDVRSSVDGIDGKSDFRIVDLPQTGTCMHLSRVSERILVSIVFAFSVRIPRTCSLTPTTLSLTEYSTKISLYQDYSKSS